MAAGCDGDDESPGNFLDRRADGGDDLGVGPDQTSRLISAGARCRGDDDDIGAGDVGIVVAAFDDRVIASIVETRTMSSAFPVASRRRHRTNDVTEPLSPARAQWCRRLAPPRPARSCGAKSPRPDRPRARPGRNGSRLNPNRMRAARLPCIGRAPQVPSRTDFASLRPAPS
jgi:hypothetical protein